ncbi:MAG: nucleoid-associated protein [Magnetococcales bacterium]|nr:nucleoid-associated protein [Magnetococcales bacterium]
MDLKNAIVHRIKRDDGQPSTIDYRDRELQNDSVPLKRLISEIRGIYEKTGKSRGVFQSDLHSYPFQNMVRQFLEKVVSFVEFTKGAVGHLKTLIDRENFAKGGYILFVLYQEEPNLFLMVAMLNDVTGTAIDEENLDVKDVLHLETRHLHLAARLNISFWRSGQDKQYLSFVNGRGAGEISKYFLNFLGCEDYSTSREQTKRFFEAVNGFCEIRQFDQQTVEEIKRKLFDHCEEKRKKKESVSLESLSFLVDEKESSEFLIYANSDDVGVNSFFDPDRAMLQKFQFFKLEKKGVRITFDKNLLGKEVILEEKSLVFTGLSDDWLSRLRGKSIV